MSTNSPQSVVRKPIVLCISGMAGTGKSTLSKKVAKKYNLRCYSGGDALKELAKEAGYEVTGEGWWESSEGLTFLEQRVKDPQFDKEVDSKLLGYAKLGDVLLDSWTMPWLLKDGFKIWLMASFDKRAARVAERDKMTFEQAFTVLKEKEAQTKAIYKKLYDFSLGEDFVPFNFILDTDHLNADQVFAVLCQVIDNIVCVC
ncbi:MAG: cytidylate kinase family protein [Candidatus Bathyarchaeota archaeon]|jgi:cytidylate kinase|uniref:cytidylate kinase-like family protein n=1 Tax=Candidatus Bathycorpusculum sp. TaxID=2994959 RepID=UPI002823487D|nr:cytidylate kinase family protein [Candidatus Termiticorpusculum sp.]MCL2257280.1 cytidylate kinase family protein [Candidatus Termiticorpusculum sp.]MCL2292584.1 cytidylate kinase family protein [Candidatus Termiticorpusculum sp.]